MIVDNLSCKRLSYENFYSKVINSPIKQNIYVYDNFIDFIINFFSVIVNNEEIFLLDQNVDFEKLKIPVRNYSLEKLNSVFEISDKVSFYSSVINSSAKIYLLTSGTTGLPKLVQHNITSLTRMLKTGEKYSNDRWALLYNPVHIAGVQVIFQAILNENFIVNLYRMKVLEVAKAIKDYEITNLSATPTFFRLLLSLKERFDFVKKITFGGERVTLELKQKLMEIFPNANIINIYASTEVGSILKSNDDIFIIPDMLANKVKIIDNELFLHRDLIQDENLNLIEDFYPTGDMVEIISTNPFKLKFIGRKNEKVKIGGYNVNIVEIEDHIRKINGVIDVYLFVRSNSVLGNVLCAEVVLDREFKIISNSLKEILSKELPDYKIPAIIKIVDKLKITNTGKLYRL